MLLSSSTTYNMGGWVYVPSGHGECSGDIHVEWYSDTACTANAMPPASASTSAARDVWQYLHKDSVVPPAGAQSAMLSPMVTNTATGPLPAAAYFDSLYLTPVPGRF